MEINEIVSAIESLTLIQASELVKALEEKFGVSAAAMAAPAAGAAAPAAEEKTDFDVVLTGFDAAAKIKVIKVVREILQMLFDKGDIYKAEYKGFYSARQEQFLQEKDRVDGKWPEIFGEVVEITESNYFFKIRQYQDWLVDFLDKNDQEVKP